MDWITLAAAVLGHCIFVTGWGESHSRQRLMVRDTGVSVTRQLALKL